MKGWQGLGPNRGRFVKGADGFAVACRGCGILQWEPQAPEAAEFRAMLEEWYFSGNWIWKEEDDEEPMDLAGLQGLPMETGRRGQLPFAGVHEAAGAKETKCSRTGGMYWNF